MNAISPPAMDADVKLLHEMGYAQELSRRMGRFSNFAVSFSLICICRAASPRSRWACPQRVARQSDSVGR